MTDDPLVLEVTAGMLDELGCHVLAATTGAAALDQLRQNDRIEILITDINMPGMDGYDLAEEAQRERASLRVLLLSGNERDSRGFPLIRKPFSVADLASVMERTTGLC